MLGGTSSHVIAHINGLAGRNKSKVRLFADDTAIYLKLSNLQEAGS